MFRTQIYASPENFTPPLEVMEVTFRRSGMRLSHLKVTWKPPSAKGSGNLLDELTRF